MSKMTSCDIELLDTGNVTNMSYMFQYCSSLTSLDLGDSFDTGDVTTMRGMFDGCNKLTLDCSSWNVDKVTDYSAFNSSAPDVIAPTWVNG